MRVGTQAATVGIRRIDSVARQAAAVVREAGSAGDRDAVGRFLGSFGGYLIVGASNASASPPANSLRVRAEAGQAGTRAKRLR
jgi:hypothetical protein